MESTCNFSTLPENLCRYFCYIKADTQPEVAVSSDQIDALLKSKQRRHHLAADRKRWRTVTKSANLGS